MRRYASQRVFNACTGEILPFHKIELESDSSFISCSPFTFEEASTTYVIGLIVISAAEINILPDENFDAFKKRIQKINGEPSSPIKSFIVTPFNLVEMEFLPQSRVVSL